MGTALNPFPLRKSRNGSRAGAIGKRLARTG